MYEGKGNKNFHYDETASKGKVYNTEFYLVCESCNHNGKMNENICTICGETMWKKSTMGRVLKNGTIKF